MHLVNEEILFISWRRFAIKEVNDWAPGVSSGNLGFREIGKQVDEHGFSSFFANFNRLQGKEH